MQDHELDALSEAMETIEAARVAIGAVLCMFAPSHPETDKERTDQEIALMLLKECKRAEIHQFIMVEISLQLWINQPINFISG